jgi:DNA-binding NtrC family response regulator
MKRPPLEIEPTAMEALLTYPWPGNVRELQNVIERMVVLSPGPRMRLTDLPVEVRNQTTPADAAAEQLTEINPNLPLAEAVEAFKRLRIRHALEAAAGNQSKAAQVLGLPRPNLSRMMKTLGLR